MSASETPAAKKPLTAVFAGGGSGGHIYPAMAIAERLVEVSPGARAIFVCSERAIDRRILSGAGVDFRPIPARPWSWRSLRQFLSGQARSRRLLEPMMRSEGVSVLVALGGFAAAPAVAVASRLGIPTTLVNLDASPGKANRWMARRCERVLSASPLPGRSVLRRLRARNGAEIEVTGMPVRRAAMARLSASGCRAALGLEPDHPTLLVLGGSQGAQSINALALAWLETAVPELAGWQVVHLCGDGAEAALRDAYRRCEVPALVEGHRAEMGLAWGAADLAISRAGASSVAEAAINAVPTLFLPYPFHRDQHQRLNAEPLVAAGAAVMADDLVEPARSLESLRPLLVSLLRDGARRQAMAAAAERASAGRDAALRIARIIAEG